MIKKLGLFFPSLFPLSVFFFYQVTSPHCLKFFSGNKVSVEEKSYQLVVRSWLSIIWWLSYSQVKTRFGIFCGRRWGLPEEIAKHHLFSLFSGWAKRWLFYSMWGKDWVICLNTDGLLSRKETSSPEWKSYGPGIPLLLTTEGIALIYQEQNAHHTLFISI